ncbi:MAG: beta-Ala-His dipeptidase [Solobacterium sp.]|nr:beta-Ala-His dipeptidase [Solobacterium sp.]
MEFDLNKRHCYYFNEIAKIPHGSFNEQAISDYLVTFAKDNGLAYKQDDKFNVIIDKPASPGYEDSEPVILQAHIDMVCEKNKDVEHDFTKDPLDLYVEDGWLKARGTTLGADDGYGVSYMLAILENKDLKHPPLSCIFTSMEEVGLLGAANLQAEDMHGRRLINLDGGGEVRTTVSSAGGATGLSHCPIRFEASTKPAYALRVRGLKGGHSGALIHMELGNSNTLLARILKELQLQGLDVQLSSFNGGLKFNAIPREADAVFVSAADPEKLQAAIRCSEANIREELEFSDPGFSVIFEPADAEKAIVQKDSDAFLNYMYLMINGFQHRSVAIEGLTAASLNAGVVTTKEDEILIEDLIRSALKTHTDDMISHLKVLAGLCGVTVEIRDRFPGWGFKADSPLRNTLREVLKERGIELKEEASHGGLECSMFKGLVEDMDIITYGPVSQGAHTPGEKLDLASFDRAFDVLCEVLARC